MNKSNADRKYSKNRNRGGNFRGAPYNNRGGRDNYYQEGGNENDFSKGTAKPRDNRGRDDQRGYNVDQNLWKQEDTQEKVKLKAAAAAIHAKV